MKTYIYNIINNPLPKLNIIKTINVIEEDFKYYDRIVKILNKQIKMNKLTSEHIYALALTNSLYPKGIIEVAKGNSNKCDSNIRELAIGLLLTGAEQFMVFHNHPGYTKEISEGDIYMTQKYRELGNLIGIDFIEHIMITKDCYMECISDEEKQLPFN